jgi:hypothetical protein
MNTRESPLNVGSFDFSKENISPSNSPVSKRRITTTFGDDLQGIPVKGRNRSKALKVLGSTPPSTVKPGFSQTQPKKRKFEDAMEDDMTDDTPSEKSRKQLPKLHTLFGIAKRLRRDLEKTESVEDTPNIDINAYRKEAFKRIERRKSGELKRRKSGDKKTSLFKNGLKKKKFSEKKHLHIRNVELSPTVMKSPEQVAKMTEQEKEEFKQQLFTDVVYGTTSPQSTPLKRSFPMSESRTPRDQDSPKTAQKKRHNRTFNIDDSLRDLVVNGLANETNTIKIEAPKFKLSLDKVFTFEQEQNCTTPRNKDTNSDRFHMDTPRPNRQSQEIKTSFELVDILADPLCREHLCNFLKKEYCEENMYFYENVLVFNTWKNKKQRLPHAKDVYQRFISVDAPEQINIDMYAITDIEERIRKCEEGVIDEHLVGLFDNVSAAVEHIMLDSYSRFVITPAYSEMIRAYYASKSIATRGLPNANRSAMNVRSNTPLKMLSKTFSVPNLKKDESKKDLEKKLGF